jgi:hypothetical protein
MSVVRDGYDVEVEELLGLTQEGNAVDLDAMLKGIAAHSQHMHDVLFTLRQMHQNDLADGTRAAVSGGTLQEAIAGDDQARQAAQMLVVTEYQIRAVFALVRAGQFEPV